MLVFNCYDKIFEVIKLWNREFYFLVHSFIHLHLLSVGAVIWTCGQLAQHGRNAWWDTEWPPGSKERESGQGFINPFWGTVPGFLTSTYETPTLKSFRLLGSATAWTQCLLNKCDTKIQIIADKVCFILNFHIKFKELNMRGKALPFSHPEDLSEQVRVQVWIHPHLTQRTLMGRKEHQWVLSPFRGLW